VFDFRIDSSSRRVRCCIGINVSDGELVPVAPFRTLFVSFARREVLVVPCASPAVWIINFAIVVEVSEECPLRVTLIVAVVVGLHASCSLRSISVFSAPPVALVLALQTRTTHFAYVPEAVGAGTCLLSVVTGRTYCEELTWYTLDNLRQSLQITFAPVSSRVVIVGIAILGNTADDIVSTIPVSGGSHTSCVFLIYVLIVWLTPATS
jgi:hypothetical protein